ncbi:ketoacyl-ACP synthase III [Actinocrinis puniceicyclus]|uniref:Beta-ketoacyl-[acyl-carrier-protein] synthase III n=1 Tax=Actinocrinis puniceicyclus TaxID=977794 RepID=A0A8J7WPV5_9ACTN|nr:beta-ketoacyl-ACP synthase III [Actinocrinis puniceicyclus]MBS2964640.1 ketoacyl-ACP synthase III [Actinocrinis puniceicyclus]
MTRAAVVAGLGCALPDRVVTNAELAALNGSSDEWIRTRTGIRQRRFAAPGTATSDLAVEAGRAALKSSGQGGADAVVVATTTPDRPCPATAPLVACRLGLSGAAAFDVGAVCTGFIYALAAAAGLIAAELADRVLVIGADTFSSILNPRDRATFAVFGDGAGAVLLRAGRGGEPGALEAFDLGSDGDGRDLITVRAGGSQQRLRDEPGDPDDQYFTMAGREVFKHAVQRMERSVRTTLERTGWQHTDLDRLVCHQANQRILDRLADLLGLAPGRTVSNISHVGNTAAASIPLALHQASADGDLRAGHRVLLTAFGGGLTWGSVTLTWPDITAA